MARNRTIYQSEAIYVSDNIDSITKSEHKNISRVQSANYGFSINRERVNQYGQLGEIDSIVVEAPNVDFEMSYYLTNGDNEYFLNLDTGYGGFLKNQIISSGQNIYIANTKEGSDINDTSANDFNVISIGNAFVTDYTVDFGVGSLPKVNVGFSALNISSQTNLTKTSGHFVGIENAGVNPLNGVKSTQQIEVLAEINQSGQSAIRPSDTSITITPTKTLGDNDSISILSTLDSGAHIQTASLNVNLDRTSLQRLGSNLAYAKVVEPPTTATVSISAIVNEVKSSSLSDILDHSNEYTIEIESVDPDGYQLCKYSLVGAKLDSESFGSAIGSNKVVDLTFTTQLGGIGQTNYNMFFEKYGFLDFFPSAAAAYSLRNLTADFDQKIVRVRRESDNSERDFTEYDIKNGTMVDWVNKQVIRPLDIRELDDANGNRPDTNDFIDTPAAAYSLRSLGENQANITIDDSSDERDGETGKFVVQTRRNVDGATKSFTAAEVTDGTMEKWVEGWSEFNELIDNSQFERDGLTIVDYQDARNFRIQANGINGFDWNLFYNNVGKHRVTFNLTLNEGQASDLSTLRLVARDGYDPDNVFTSNSASLSEGYNDIEINNIDNLVPSLPKLMFQKHYSVEGNFDVTISNLKVYKSTVNELPLDQATGAAAAYSLRNLSSSGTDVTTSGDTAGDTTGKYVVQVRRSRDNAVESFTASEVADGTLEDWITTLYSSSFSTGTDGAVGTRTVVTHETNHVSDGITSHNNVLKIELDPNEITSQRSFKLNDDARLAVNDGSTYGISFKYYIPSGTDIVNIRALVGGTGLTNFCGIGSSFNTTGEWVEVSSEGLVESSVPTENTLRFYINSASSVPTGSTGQVYIKDVVLKKISTDGHVQTWYDQSGSDNHAVQTTPANQPKIVDGGSLLEDGIDFDGTSHFFDIDFGSNLSQPNSFFLSHTSDTTNSGLNEYFDTASGSPRTLLDVGAGYRLLAGIDFDSGFAMETNRVLISAFANSTSSFIFKNGVSSVVGDAGTDSINQYSYLGRSFDRYYDGKMDEFIIYNSDQSTKRRAIEENIANHYNIALADSSRDGTVRTWYDQSGYDNHAVQTDPTKQPKIVDGGTYLGEVDFLDGTDTFLETTNSDLCNVSELSVFTVLKPHIVGGQCVAFSCGSTVAASNAYGGWKLNLNGYIDSAALETQAVGNSALTSVGASVTADDTLLSYIATFPNVSAFANGQAGTATTSAVSPNNSNEVKRRFRIGCQYTFQTAAFYTKPIKEIIIYNSDQSANRTAIEANIGEHYGIVGIPAYENKVNGFVETWYDQSGSGNDMKQPTSSKQPKIVGEVTPGQPHALLENGLKFDGGQQLINTGGIGGGSDIALYLVGNRDNDLITRNTFVGTNTDFALGSSDQLMLRVNSSNSFTLNITPPTAGEQVLYAALVSDRLPTLKQNNTSRTRSSAFDTDITNTFSIIGDNGTTPHPTYALVGSIAEIIYYTSDQSSNSPAIEANIANHYGITLS